MATTIVTARDLILTIATVNYDAQTTAATLVNAPVITTYQTLDGKAYKHIDDQWTLNLEQLVISIMAAMPAGYEVGDVQRPTIQQVGATNLLVADLAVSTYYTQQSI